MRRRHQNWLSALLVASGLTAGAGTAHAQPAPESVECRRDLLVADSTMRNARLNLEASASTADADRCGVWQRYVTSLRTARGQYAACLTGPMRSRRLAEIDDAIAQVAPAMRDRCGRGPANPVERPRPRG